jgi:hypothetical protein
MAIGSFAAIFVIFDHRQKKKPPSISAIFVSTAQKLES